MLLVRLSWRNLWRNRRRTIITIAAVFFAGYAVISMRSLQLGTYDNMIRNIVGSTEGFIQVQDTAYWNEQIIDNGLSQDESLYQQIANSQGVMSVSPRLSSFSLASSGNRTRVIRVLCIDPEKEAQLDIPKLLQNGSANPGDGVILSSDLAKYLKMGIGDSVVLIGQGYHGMSANALLPIEGIIKLPNPELNSRLAVMSLNTGQYVFAADGLLTAYAINTDPNADLFEVQANIKASISNEQYAVVNWQEMMPELVQTIEADSGGGKIMAGVLYIVISFSLFGTFIMLAAERKREYGMLIGLGMRRGQLMLMAFFEASFMALMGSGLAILITRPQSLYFYHNPIQLTGQALDAMKEMGMEASMQASIDWSIALTHGAVLVVLTLLISLYSVFAIKRIEPVNAMRS